MAAFTTIAAGVGVAATGITTGMSIGQAVKQKRAMKEANAAAAKSMAEARKRLDVNVYESLGIPKEGYELQREALLQQGQAALQAGTEGSQRGAAATAGRVQLAQQQGQGQVRAQMGQELYNLQRMTASEESRLADMGFQLDLEEAKGAQMAAGQAAQARQEALKGISAGIGQLGQQAMMLAPLFPQDLGAQQAALAEAGLEGLSKEDLAKFQDIKAKNILGRDVDINPMGGGNIVELPNIGNLSPKEFRQFRRGLNPVQQQILFDRKAFTDAYNPFALYGGTNPADTYMKNMMMMSLFNQQYNQNNQGN